MFKPVLAAIAALALAPAVSAAVVSIDVTSSAPGVYAAVIGTPPGGKVGKNNVNIDTVFAFDEEQNTVLLTAVDVNVGSTIAAGTRISSHYIVWDPVVVFSDKPRNKRVKGTVTFAQKILGVMTKKEELDASNSLGNPSITYNTSNFIGLEGGDKLTFLGNVLNFDLKASNPGDHVRVITEAAPIPLPAAGGLLMLALGGLAMARRRKTA